MEDNKFTVINDEGKEITCDILFTFDSEETGKSYIVYTDNSKNEEGDVNVFASTYDPNDENTALGAIETEQEWKVIETILSTLQEEIQKRGRPDGADD